MTEVVKVIFTALAYARAVLGVVILSICLSIHLSVRLWDAWIVTKLNDALQIFFILHKRAITLLLWHQQWLVDDAPFPLKSALKVTTPFEKRRLRPISAHNVSTVGDSEKSSTLYKHHVDWLIVVSFMIITVFSHINSNLCTLWLDLHDSWLTYDSAIRIECDSWFDLHDSFVTSPLAT